MTLTYGATSVPWTVSWSAEGSFFVGPCIHAGGRLAICQPSAPGQGRPQFFKPHSQRQRQAIGAGLCDLCGKSLKVATKVSLSHARPVLHAVETGDILQVEPLLRRECARISMRFCPALKRDIANGTLMVRQVTRWRAQLAIMSSVYVEAVTGRPVKAVGHAKVQLLAWVDRDQDWLEAA